MLDITDRKMAEDAIKLEYAEAIRPNQIFG
jgi:hypothetical protein